MSIRMSIFPCDRCNWIGPDCTCAKWRAEQLAAAKARAAEPTPEPAPQPSRVAAHLPAPPAPIQLPPDPAGRRWAQPVVEVIRDTRRAS